MALADWYNQDQIAGLEALYGEGATGKPSDARHISAMSNLSDTFAGKTRAEALGLGTPNKLNQFIGDTGAFGAGLINEIPGVYRSIKGQAPVGDVWEDIKANWKGTYGTPYGTSSEDIYKEVYAPDETPTLALDRNKLPRPTHLGFNYNYDANAMDRLGNTVAPNIPMDRFGNTVAPNIPMGEEIQETETVTDPDWDRHMRMINSESAEEEGIFAPNKWQQFLSKYTRQPYRGAQRHTRDFTPAQLNRLNALGGWYSEPARQQRRDRRSVDTLLARKAAAEAGTGAFSQHAQQKLNQLTLGSRPGHYDRPGGDSTPRGTDTPASGPGGWGPGAAQGGYMRSQYNKGGRVGILSVF